MSKILFFQTLSSFVEVPFWVELGQHKIDKFKLDDSPHPAQAFYSAGAAQGDASARLCMTHGYLLDDPAVPNKLPPFQYPSRGTVKNTNTLEEFRKLNWTGQLNEAGLALWEDIKSGAALRDPWLLTRFLLVTFADLKKYRYVYFFAFPSFIQQKPYTVAAQSLIREAYSEAQVASLYTALEAYRADESVSASNRAFFLIRARGDDVSVAPLAAWRDVFGDASSGEFTVGFADPSGNATAPAWHLRNLLVLLQRQCGVKRVRVVCLREVAGKRDISASLVIDVDAHEDVSGDAMPKVTGWEKNDADKLQPRSLDLAPLMDPTHLASTAIDLNLKLMRWRLMPSLDLARVSSTRCLLFGAGTLGCNVARVLLGWGVRHITFVDSGRVSYSNPVRQSLFEFADCIDGGKPKAEAAAASLKRIFPGLTTVGHDITIPMPGHHVDDAAATERDIARLAALVDEHDAVYVLTDSRESRWLPTLLCSMKNKIMINCALGFDTYLVMRHGAGPDGGQSPRLGCYYCNDIMAPSDSLTDRTLDQQCTVTRPGLSFAAASHGVELMVSMLQHADGIAAPADTGRDNAASCPLGIIPHQVRGFLSMFKSEPMVGHAYDKCTACSAVVHEKYREGGFEFMRQALEDPKYLEQVTGLQELHRATEEWAAGDDDEDDF